MKKNKIIQFIVTGMFLFGATACTGNFEDYNKNPVSYTHLDVYKRQMQNQL